MDEYKVLYERGQPLYAGKGNFRPLIRSMATVYKKKYAFPFFRLLLQSYKLFHARKKYPLLVVAEQIETALAPSIVQAAFLHDTSHYKETKAVAIVQTLDNTYEVKAYALPEECLFEERQARFVHEMFSGSFVTTPLVMTSGTCLFFQWIKPFRAVQEDDHIEERLLHITKVFLDRHAVTKELTDCVPLDFYALCHGTPYAELGRKVRAWAEKNTKTIRHIPVHGDMTPWNMFVNQEEKIVLTHYGRAGWQVPFYDLFHYVLQPQAIKKNRKALEKILYKKPWFHGDGIKTLLTLYVIDQFYLDLSSHKMQKFDHATLMHKIETKAFWLDVLLRD